MLRTDGVLMGKYDIIKINKSNESLVEFLLVNAAVTVLCTSLFCNENSNKTTLVKRHEGHNYVAAKQLMMESDNKTWII